MVHFKEIISIFAAWLAIAGCLVRMHSLLYSQKIHPHTYKWAKLNSKPESPMENITSKTWAGVHKRTSVVYLSTTVVLLDMQRVWGECNSVCKERWLDAKTDLVDANTFSHIYLFKEMLRVQARKSTTTVYVSINLYCVPSAWFKFELFVWWKYSNTKKAYTPGWTID